MLVPLTFTAWEALDPQEQGCALHVPSLAQSHLDWLWKGKKVYVKAIKSSFERDGAHFLKAAFFDELAKMESLLQLDLEACLYWHN